MAAERSRNRDLRDHLINSRVAALYKPAEFKARLKNLDG